MTSQLLIHVRHRYCGIDLRESFPVPPIIDLYNYHVLIMPLHPDGAFSITHALCYQPKNCNGGHKQHKVVELEAVRLVAGDNRDEPTAVLEYALSSASVRASTKRRRKFGRFA
jgi:hypothetical protein